MLFLISVYAILGLLTDVKFAKRINNTRYRMTTIFSILTSILIYIIFNSFINKLMFIPIAFFMLNIIFIFYWEEVGNAKIIMEILFGFKKIDYINQIISILLFDLIIYNFTIDSRIFILLFIISSSIPNYGLVGNICIIPFLFFWLSDNLLYNIVYMSFISFCWVFIKFVHGANGM